MLSIELKFKKFLLGKINYLNEEKIKRKSKGERPVHLRFSRGCGIKTLAEFKTLFTDLKITLIPNDSYTGSPSYKGQGFDLVWENQKIGVLYGVSNTGVERKKFTPQSLGLTEIKFDDPVFFRKKIVEGLELVEEDKLFVECLISMLDNLEGKTKIKSHNFLTENLNRITSDFGEVLSAYKSAINGNTIDKFPKSSNNTFADYYENGTPVSAKGIKSGNKVNLMEYKDLINRSDNVSEFFYAIATHNKDNFFKFGSTLCSQAQTLSEWASGTTELKVKEYVCSVTYDDFYTKVQKEFQGLGVPLKSKDARPRQLWLEGDTNPFYFTLNTVIHRFWGTKETEKITNFVLGFLNNLKFVHVDIKNDDVVIEELISSNELSSHSKQWQTAYWSRATKAWHNWMGIELKRESE